MPTQTSLKAKWVDKKLIAESIEEFANELKLISRTSFTTEAQIQSCQEFIAGVRECLKI